MTRLPPTRALTLLALACALAACSRSESPEPPKPATAKPAPAPRSEAGSDQREQSGPATPLTIYIVVIDLLANAGEPRGRYPPGFALIDSTLLYTLAAGANPSPLAHLPRAIDSASATLRGNG